MSCNSGGSSDEKNMEEMMVKVSRSKSATKKVKFLKSGKLALCKIVVEQTRQVLKTSLTVHTYAMKNSRIRELFIHVFSRKSCPGTLLNDTRLLQLTLDSSQVEAQIQYEMTLSIAFASQLSFQAIALMSRKAERNGCTSSETQRMAHWKAWRFSFSGSIGRHSRSLVSLVTAYCDTALSVVKSLGNSVSEIIEAIRRVLVTDNTRNTVYSGVI